MTAFSPRRPITAAVAAPLLYGDIFWVNNEVLGEQTTTGVELVGATITDNLSISSSYLGVWSMDLLSNATNSEAIADVVIDDVSIFIENPSVRPTDTADYYSYGGIFFFQTGSEPTLHTFKKKGKRGPNAATLKVRNSRLSLLRLGALDVTASSQARQTFADPANKSAQTAATLAFTPPTTGDYIIVAGFNLDCNTGANTAIGVELTDGTTSSGEITLRPNAQADRWPGMLVLPLPALSGAKTVTLKVRQTGAGTATIGISEIRMIAIRADRFHATYSAKLAADNSGAETSYTTSHSQTFTPRAVPHLTIAGWAVGGSSASIAAASSFNDNATLVDEDTQKIAAAAAGQGYFGAGHRIATFAASSRTQSIQRKSGTGAGTTMIQKGAAITAFDLGEGLNQVAIVNPGDGGWIVPYGWSSIQVEAIGAGGNSGLGTRNNPNNYAGGGGGGGQYAKLATLAVTPGVTVQLHVGTAGGARGSSGAPGAGDSWFSSAATFYAQAGAAGVKEVGGAGGNAAAVGSCSVNNGGAGGSAGTSAWNGGGGGGSGGPSGAGKAGGFSNGASGAEGGGGGGSNGGSSTAGHDWDATNPGQGGEGTAGTGGGTVGNNGTAGGGGGSGNTGTSSAAGRGGVEALWPGNYGPSGGGGGAIYFDGHQGGAGGSYGGGAGGNKWDLNPSGTPGVGGQGIIIITRLA